MIEETSIEQIRKNQREKIREKLRFVIDNSSELKTGSYKSLDFINSEEILSRLGQHYELEIFRKWQADSKQKDNVGDYVIKIKDFVNDALKTEFSRTIQEVDLRLRRDYSRRMSSNSELRQAIKDLLNAYFVDGFKAIDKQYAFKALRKEVNELESTDNLNKKLDELKANPNLIIQSNTKLQAGKALQTYFNKASWYQGNPAEYPYKKEMKIDLRRPSHSSHMDRMLSYESSDQDIGEVPKHLAALFERLSESNISHIYERNGDKDMKIWLFDSTGRELNKWRISSEDGLPPANQHPEPLIENQTIYKLEMESREYRKYKRMLDSSLDKIAEFIEDVTVQDPEPTAITSLTMTRRDSTRAPSQYN